MPTLLVVDDDRAVQQMLVDFLGERGYDVHTCRDGAQVMGMLSSRHYDLMILDVLIPHVNGFSLIEKVRGDLGLRDLPVLMISGIYRSRNHRHDMLTRFGVVDYLDKPLSIERLSSIVESVCGPGTDAGRDRRRTTKPPALLPDVLPNVPLNDLGNSESGAQHALGHASDLLRPGAIAAQRRPSAREPAAEHLVDREARQEKAQVESEARTGFRPSAFVLQGTLRKTPVAALLGRLWNEGVSGALLLRHEHIKKIVYLRGGCAYAVRSNRVSECLGNLLVRERLISEAQCEASIDAMQTTGQRQGEVLVSARAITDKNLRFALELQLETKLFDVFAWDAGEFRFNASAPLPTAESQLEWRGPALIVEGIRRTYDETRLRTQMLPILDVPLRWRQPDIGLDNLRLGEREAQAVAKLTLPQSSRQLLDSMGLEPPEALRIIYTLIALQLLTPAS